MKNMKIEINEQQPLDDVVRELERLGYKREAWTYYQCKLIVAFHDGLYSNFNYCGNSDYKTTTLAELKEM